MSGARGRARTVNVAERKRVVARAVEVGDGRAAEEAGVARATVRSWRRREREAGSEVASVSPGASAVGLGESSGDLGVVSCDGAVRAVLERAQAAHDTSIEVQQAIRRAVRLGKTTGTKDLSLALGILIDQGSKLEEAARRLAEDRVRIDDEQQRLVAAVIEDFLGALDIPLSRAARKVLAFLLRRAGEGEGWSAPEPEAAQARGELRAHVLRQVAGSVEPDWGFLRQLPAPVEEGES